MSTLSQKMAWKLGALTAGLLLVIGVALWGLLGMDRGVSIARSEYRELRLIRNADHHWSQALGLKSAGYRGSALRDQVDATLGQVNAFIDYNETEHRFNPAHEIAEAQHAYPIRDDLQQLLALLEVTDQRGPSADEAKAIDDLFSAVSAITDHLLTDMDTAIASTHESTSARLDMTFVLLGVVSSLVILVTILLCIHQYRGVMMPLNRLRDGVRRIAAGNLSERVKVDGEREFATLATDFNQMAEELDSVYRNLEERVRVQSSELARSERLASVGYLAAGVAHEINNPLNIISAYAELTLRRLRDRNLLNGTDDESTKGLEIIRDEALRCKEISQKLLSLSRTSPNRAAPVALGHCARDVAYLVSGLKQYADRRVVTDLQPGVDLTVMGNETEFKQVLLNLVVNGLDAVAPAEGVVHIEGTRENGWVQLRVSDNGKGMGADVLSNIFEPFYASKPRSAGAGVGLGLSITRAIVESHRGTITAASDGPGQGSTFTLRFPHASRNDGHAGSTTDAT